MKNYRFLLVAGISLALAFTFGCSSGDDGSGGGDGGWYKPNDENHRCRSGVTEYKCGDEWINNAKYICMSNSDEDGNINYYTLIYKQWLEQNGYVRCGDFYYHPDYNEFQRCQNGILEAKSGDAWITYEQFLEQNGWVRCR